VPSERIVNDMALLASPSKSTKPYEIELGSGVPPVRTWPLRGPFVATNLYEEQTGGATTTVVGTMTSSVRVKADGMIKVASVVWNVDGTNSVCVTVTGTWFVIVATRSDVGVTVTVEVEVVVVVTVFCERVAVLPVIPMQLHAELYLGAPEQAVA